MRPGWPVLGDGLAIGAGPVAEVIVGRERKPHGLLSFLGECTFRGLRSSPGPRRRAFLSVSGGRKEFGNKPCAGQ